MLHSADERLALREPALPALGLLLDDDALGDWLSDRVGTAVRVRPRYLRYKYGTSCVVAAEVVSDTARWPCLFTAYGDDDTAKLHKTVERAPAGSVLGADPGRCLLATTPTADRDLPGLAVAGDSARLRRALRRMLGDRHGLRRARVRTLSYKPQRRWVGLVRLPHHQRLVVRAYRPARSGPAAAAIGAWEGHGPPTPRLLGQDPRRSLLALEYVPGTALPRRNASTEHTTADFAQAGRVLASMHRASDARPPTRGSLAAETRAVHAAARQLQVLLPDLGDEVREVETSVTARLAALGGRADARRTPIHGDFSADQVVRGPHGGLTVIDLDASRWGDPGEDLGCAAAALARDGVLGTVDGADEAAWLGTMFDAYADERDLDPASVGTHEAAHLLRRAVEPFRLRLTPDWPAAAQALVARSRSALEHGAVAGGTRR